MAISEIGLIIVAAINFFLGLFVFRKNRSSHINLAFFIFALGMAVWAAANALFNILDDSLAFYDAMIAYYAGAVLSLSFFYFSLVFPRGASWVRNSLYLLFFWGLAWFVIIGVPGITLRGIVDLHGVRSLITGWGLVFHFASITILMFGGLAVLTYKWVIFRGLLRLQLIYVLWGVLIATIFGVICNLILPLRNDYSLVWLGPYFTLFIFVLTSYAIINHHLMDIRVIIGRGAVFTALFFILSFIYAFLGTVVSEILPGYSRHAVAALIVVAGFIPLKNALEWLTDATFFRRRYSLDRAFSELERVIYDAGLDLDSALKTFNTLVIEALRVKKGSILILIPKDSFISRQMINSNIDEDFELKFDHPIVSAIKVPGFCIIDRDDLEANRYNVNDHNPEHIHDPKLIGELDAIGFQAAVPIKFKENLIGVYLLGEKKSGDPFFAGDLAFLEHAVRAIGPVIESARMFEELKNLDEAKSNFISTVSHQLRTPLSSARWNIELLNDGQVASKEKSELICSAHDNVILATSRLNSLLTVLDIEQGRVLINAERRVLLDDLRKIAEHVKREIGSPAEIKISAHKSVSEAVYDPEKIKNIVSALFENALVYSGLDKQVEVNVDLKPIGSVVQVVMTVMDSGIGLDERIKPHIFQKFFRGDGARAMLPNGFGLSLFVARSFAQAHGGDIWFESPGVGRGSTFYFSIPLSPRDTKIKKYGDKK